MGVALLTYGLIYPFPQLWESWPEWYPVLTTIFFLNFAFQALVFPLAAVRFFEDFVKPVGRWVRWTIYGISFLTAIAALAGARYRITLTLLSVIGTSGESIALLSIIYFGISLFYMIQGWRLSRKEAQKRYGLLVTALTLVIASQILQLFNFAVATQTGSFGGYASSNSVLLAQILGGIVAPILFAYAIFRHKVLDISFAINRTLVYGVVTTILLVAFGLIEWAFDHFVKIDGREKNAYVDAAIALCVFLTFHRVRDFVEEWIEKLFFKAWHDKEAMLKKFVKEAGFITKPEALTRAFAVATSRFGEGAQSALYVKFEDGDYVLGEGGIDNAPAKIDADHPALVRLRAAPKAPEMEDSDLHAALILPMLNRNEVMGVVLLAAKPTGNSFRPDEIEALSHAAIQIGLDLHALKIEALEAANATWELRYNEIKALVPLKS